MGAIVGVHSGSTRLAARWGSRTTLMGAIGGVQVPRWGRATVPGPLAGSQRLRDRVGYLTQPRALTRTWPFGRNLQYFPCPLGASARCPERVLGASARCPERGIGEV